MYGTSNEVVLISIQPRMLWWRERVCYEEIVFEFEFRVSTQASSRKKRGKPLRAVSIENLGAEILNKDLQNTSQHCCP
jgi:hypothetical protein